MASETLKSVSVIKNPSTVPTAVRYYCTEDEWRNYSGYTNQHDFPSSEVVLFLEDATEQVKKDAFHRVRWELVTKDSSDRYFTARKYWGNKYGTHGDKTEIIHGRITKYDIEVWEADTTSSVAASLFLQGTRVNRLEYTIPYDAITEIDPVNCWFKLSSDFPTSGRQVFVTYYVSGKPMDEIGYELKRACMEYAIVLALRKLKRKRLKFGTTSLSLGKKSLTRDEKAFDDMVKDHMKEYHSWIRWIKPFIGRKVKIGRMETEDARRVLRRY